MNSPENNELILLTGGGTAGHVTPISPLPSGSWPSVMRSSTPVQDRESNEREIVERFGIKFHSVASGKLRRYFSWKNFVDAFRVVQGVVQGFFLVRRLRPALIFSKRRLRCISDRRRRLDESLAACSDPRIRLSPGLATKLSAPFADTICTTFSDTRALLSASARVQETGTPIRSELMRGKREAGLAFCGVHRRQKSSDGNGRKPGSKRDQLRLARAAVGATRKVRYRPSLRQGQLNGLSSADGYKQIEYLHSEIADVFACADLVLSRAGSNSIFELLALRKKNVLIPLSRKASRGDQIQNARYFERMGYSRMILEEDLTELLLIETLLKCDGEEFPALQSAAADGTDRIVTILLQSWQGNRAFKANNLRKISRSMIQIIKPTEKIYSNAASHLHQFLLLPENMGRTNTSLRGIMVELARLGRTFAG